LLLLHRVTSRSTKAITGSGHVTTENRTVQGEFKSIEVSNAIDLIIEQSNKTEIIVTADDNLQKKYHYNSKKWRTYYIL
jgi:hypothetical protein